MYVLIDHHGVGIHTQIALYFVYIYVTMIVKCCIHACICDDTVLVLLFVAICMTEETWILD